MLAICCLQPARAQSPESDIKTYQSQVNVCLQKGDAPGAQAAIEQSLSAAEKAFAGTEKMVEPLDFAARAYAAMHQGPMAERSLLKIIEIHKRVKGPKDPLVAQDQAVLADLYASLGQLPQADSYYRQSIDVLDRETFYRTSSLPPILDNFAKVLHAEKKDSEAKEVEEKAQKYRDKRF